MLLVEALRDEVMTELGVVMAEESEGRLRSKDEFVRSLRGLLALYRRAWAAYEEVTATEGNSIEQAIWESVIELPAEVWDAVDEIAMATSWDEVSYHPSGSPGHCKLCDSLGW